MEAQFHATEVFEVNESADMEINPILDVASDPAAQMLHLLLQSASLACISDMDHYVCSLEEIVFELVACQVGHADRGVARALYQQGVAIGLHGLTEPSSTAVSNYLDDEISPLLKSIRMTGERHGYAIGLEMDRFSR